MAELTSAKRELRSEMRQMRRSLPDQVERSIRLWSHVRSIPAVRAARCVMVFNSIPGEPATESFVLWLRSAGKTVLFPEDDPAPEPTRPDVVIVPGIAFTAAGDRLGQGGGWYDRFLVDIREGCVTIGVGFEPQLIADLPTEPHDVRLEMVITDAGLAM